MLESYKFTPTPQPQFRKGIPQTCYDSTAGYIQYPTSGWKQQFLAFLVKIGNEKKGQRAPKFEKDHFELGLHGWRPEFERFLKVPTVLGKQNCRILKLHVKRSGGPCTCTIMYGFMYFCTVWLPAWLAGCASVCMYVRPYVRIWHPACLFFQVNHAV